MSGSAKIIFLGEAKVGKSQILYRYSSKAYSDTYSATIGAEFFTEGADEYKLQFWDVSGDKRFSHTVSIYCTNIHMAILCYDITSQESFDALPKYVNLAKKASPGVRFILVGTKCDLDDNREVDFIDAQNFANENSAIVHNVEVSAKENKGIYELFDYVAQNCVQNDSKPDSNSGDNHFSDEQEIKVDYLNFLSAYDSAYNDAFFKNRIKGRCWGENGNIDDVKTYAENNPKTRTARVYNRLVEFNTHGNSGCGCKPV